MAKGLRSGTSSSRDELRLVPEPEKPSAGACKPELLRAIEAEIIPRLMLAYHSVQQLDAPAGEGPGPDGLIPSPSEVDEFARFVVTEPSSQVLDRVDAYRRRGVTPEVMFTEFLPAVARHLGDLWSADVCSFTDVTIGLGRLQQLVHDLGESLSPRADPAGPSLRMLLAPAPGEQHTLGMYILAELLRVEGWVVKTESTGQPLEIEAILRDEWLDVLGLTISNPELRQQVAPTIRKLRKASRNPNLVVLVGGSAARQDEAGSLGADACPPDAKAALLFMEGVRHNATLRSVR